MATLAWTLKLRGHEVVFVGVPDAESIVRGAGVKFAPTAKKSIP